MAVVSTMPPARCGLASFAADLIEAVEQAAPGTKVTRVVMTQSCEEDANGIGDESIELGDPSSYDRVATWLNDAGFDLLCLQHEYGIFGGADGELLLRLLDRVRMRVVVTLHTVLEKPSSNQRRVMDAIIRRADRLVVMTERSAELMRQVHGVIKGNVDVIPHGIPDRASADRAAGIAILGAGGRTVLLTFGLLSPGKGIEHVVAALPQIAAARPDVLYIVVGATHPNQIRRQGENYRQKLEDLANQLGVSRHVHFLDRYIDLPELTATLAATDIYITPYLNEVQSVSGTLAFSYGLGNAVVSTPYHHAAELLADGRGVLVPFADPDAIAAAVIDLLNDPDRLSEMRAAALAAGQNMGWTSIGERYVTLFRQLAASVVNVGAVPASATGSGALDTVFNPLKVG